MTLWAEPVASLAVLLRGTFDDNQVLRLCGDGVPQRGAAPAGNARSPSPPSARTVGSAEVYPHLVRVRRSAGSP